MTNKKILKTFRLIAIRRRWWWAFFYFEFRDISDLSRFSMQGGEFNKRTDVW